ncbi:MAG: HPF/RaiA family ribosome-associated protein [Burkholderiaceae bacterium]
MQYDIQCLGFPATTALTSHVRRRLGFGLTRHSARVVRVVVRLGDENGPRGGVDKFCRIQVQLIDAPQVVIRDCGPELYAVIDRAGDRTARAVAKRLERARFGLKPVAPARLWQISMEHDPRSGAMRQIPDGSRTSASFAG